MNKVTISLERYESMQQEIKTLREEVKLKEVIRLEPIDYTKICFTIVLSVMIILMFVFAFQISSI